MPETTYREALRQALRYQLQHDERVFLMGEDIGAYGGSYAVTKGFLDEFGERRVKDTPIAESVVLGTGIGAAMAGLKPMVELMTINFSLLAIDQIVNNASKLYYMSNGQINVPIVIRMAGGAGSQLGAQHSHSLESFIEHTALYASKGDVPDEPYSIPFAKLDVHRAGGDVTLIGYSGSVHQAARAAAQLAEQGVDAEVLNLRTLRPLDVDGILASIRKTHRAIVVEDDWKFGGFAGEIAAIVQEQAFDDLDAPVMRCSGADVPMPYAGALEQAALPQEADIVRMALELVA
jgi:pyruvate dehydrogenase E1 component beta subunit